MHSTVRQRYIKLVVINVHQSNKTTENNLVKNILNHKRGQISVSLSEFIKVYFISISILKVVV